MSQCQGQLPLACCRPLVSPQSGRAPTPHCDKATLLKGGSLPPYTHVHAHVHTGTCVHNTQVQSHMYTGMCTHV